MKIVDQWVLFLVASSLTGNAVRNYVNGHWWAAAETLLSILAWVALGRFRRNLYGSPWPKVR